jgi:hypothetical protein
MRNLTMHKSEINQLQGNEVAWAKLALLQCGIDATVEECNNWLEKRFLIYNNEHKLIAINENDLEDAKRVLHSEDPAKKYLTKVRILDGLALELLNAAEGRNALRNNIKLLPHDKLLELLGYGPK